MERRGRIKISYLGDLFAKQDGEAVSTLTPSPPLLPPPSSLGTSILHREKRALNFFRYGKYTAGRLDAASFCFSFTDGVRCMYLLNSVIVS